MTFHKWLFFTVFRRAGCEWQDCLGYYNEKRYVEQRKMISAYEARVRFHEFGLKVGDSPKRPARRGDDILAVDRSFPVWTIQDELRGRKTCQEPRQIVAGPESTILRQGNRDQRRGRREFYKSGLN